MITPQWHHKWMDPEKHHALNQHEPIWSTFFFLSNGFQDARPLNTSCASLRNAFYFKSALRWIASEIFTIPFSLLDLTPSRLISHFSSSDLEQPFKTQLPDWLIVEGAIIKVHEWWAQWPGIEDAYGAWHCGNLELTFLVLLNRYQINMAFLLAGRNYQKHSWKLQLSMRGTHMENLLFHLAASSWQTQKKV